METDWDLRAVPITSRSPPPNMFTRMGTNGILGSSIESLNPLKNFANPVTLKAPCCPNCSSECEKEVAKLKELEKLPDEVKSSLPQWLQNAKPKDQSQVKDQEMDIKQKIQDLQKKWNDNCLRVHPNYNQSPRLDRVLSMAMSVPLTEAIN